MRAIRIVAVTLALSLLAIAPGSLAIEFEHVASIHLGSRYQKIVERDGYWYLAGEWGLECWRFNEQGEFIRLSEVATPGIAQWVALEGDYAYVADGWEGLTIVDVSDPNNLRFVSNTQPSGFDGADYADEVSYVCVSNGTAYLSGRHGVIAVDVSNQVLPIPAIRLSYPDPDADLISTTGMTLRLGQHLWVARADAPFHGDTTFFGIYQYDLANPNYPTYVGYYPTAFYSPRFLAVQDSVLYVAGNWALHSYRLLPNGGLAALDSLIDLLFMISDPQDIAMEDGTLYLAGRGSPTTGGIAVVDILDPANLAIREISRQMKKFNCLASNGSEVVAGRWDNDLLILNRGIDGFLDSTQFIETSSQARDLVQSDDFLYVADKEKGVLCFDLSTPTIPQQCETLNLTSPVCIDYMGTRLLVGHETSSYLKVYDCSEPSNPKIVDSLLLETGTTPSALTHRDSVLRICSGRLHTVVSSEGEYKQLNPVSALQAVAVATNSEFVATPRSLFAIQPDVSISHVADFGNVGYPVTGIALCDSLIYTADWFQGLGVFRVNGSSNVEFVSRWDTVSSSGYPGSANDVCIFSDSLLLLAHGELGIEIIDVADHTNPRHTGRLPTSAYAQALSLGPEYLCVGDLLGVEVFSHDGLIAVDDAEDPLPREFKLHQNYPNPFNSSTVLSFDVFSAAEIELEIYNTSGQAVGRLASAPYRPGSYEAQWNGTDGHGKEVASGVYYARLRSNHQLQTVKLIIVR